MAGAPVDGGQGKRVWRIGREVDALDAVSLRELLLTSHAVRAAARSSAAPFRYAAAVRRALHLAAADIVSCAATASVADDSHCLSVPSPPRQTSPPSAIAVDPDATVPAIPTATTGTLHPHLPPQPSEPPPSILPLPVQLRLEQLRNLAENARTGYLDTAEMWVLARERTDAALRRLQNAAASGSSSSSFFATPQSDAPGDVHDSDDEQGDPCFALAAAVLAQACEIELVDSSAHPRHVLRRFRLWFRLDHGHTHATTPAAADSTVVPLTLELRDVFNFGIISRNWAVLVTSAAPDAASHDAAAVATLCALVKKAIGPADTEQSAHGVMRWTILREIKFEPDTHQQHIHQFHQQVLQLHMSLHRQISQQQQRQQQRENGNGATNVHTLHTEVPFPRHQMIAQLMPQQLFQMTLLHQTPQQQHQQLFVQHMAPLQLFQLNQSLPQQHAAYVDRWTPALATAAVQALLVWPLPDATSAALPVSPALHAAVMRHPLLRDALRAFAVAPDAQASPAPPRGVARLELSRFWIAAVVSVVEEALDIVLQQL
ncbi:hypothetical protein HK405_011357 [Cladochytrium tenue]|nr:hypothetical protein HK405_011357 [Cladochytrium tenue]